MKLIPPAAINTNRLLLRELAGRDEAAIFALRSDDLVNRFLDRPRQTTVGEARDFITKISQGVAEGRSYYWAITEKPGDELIGTICIWNLSADGSTAELGYELLPSNQGRGIMREALEAVIGFAFHKAGLRKLEAWTHPDNQASTSLLLKSGFQQDMSRKNAGTDKHLIFFLTGV